MAAVLGAIFDYKTILVADPQVQREVGEMLRGLRARGVLICVLTTDSVDLGSLMTVRGLPSPDLHVSYADVVSGRRRGSPDWVDVVTSSWNVRREQLMYVGCMAVDWRTAINSAVLYLHARWAGRIPAGTRSYTADVPSEIIQWYDDLLSSGPHWSYWLDRELPSTSIRSLLPASAQLPKSRRATFSLQDVFTYDRKPTIGGVSARDVLMLRVIVNCYLEGLLAPGSYFCIYPGSRVGASSPQIEEYAQPASVIVHGFFKPDLLQRVVDAPDTSRERAAARREGRVARVSIATQSNSVALNPRYRSSLRGRQVVVFDDFTTKGMSLDWARTLLLAAGAAHVVLVTIGKYGATYTHYAPKGVVDPFEVSDYSTADFEPYEIRLSQSDAAPGEISSSFESLVLDS